MTDKYESMDTDALKAECRARGIRLSRDVEKTTPDGVKKYQYALTPSQMREALRKHDRAVAGTGATVMAALRDLCDAAAAIPATMVKPAEPAAAITVSDAVAPASTSAAPAPAATTPATTPAPTSAESGYVDGIRIIAPANPATGAQMRLEASETAKNARNMWANFISEWGWIPSRRMLNTLARMRTVTEAEEYINAYAKLIVSEDANSVREKLRSHEGREVLRALVSCTPHNRINRRLRIYFGYAGTGKTTAALEEARAIFPDAERFICRDDMTADEVFRGFTLVDGVANLADNAITRAMAAGTPVVMDEINLLPRGCLTALQTVTDGTPDALINGHTVRVQEGFCVYATMNHVVNGQPYALPEPLCDRAEVLREFEGNPEMDAEIALM